MPAVDTTVLFPLSLPVPGLGQRCWLQARSAEHSPALEPGSDSLGGWVSQLTPATFLTCCLGGALSQVINRLKMTLEICTKMRQRRGSSPDTSQCLHLLVSLRCGTKRVPGGPGLGCDETRALVGNHYPPHKRRGRAERKGAEAE